MFAFEALGVPLSFDKAAVTGVRGGTSRSVIMAKDICSGHKEKTLALLWSIMFHWQMPTLVDGDRLRKEAAIIRRCYAKANAIVSALEREQADTPTAAAPTPTASLSAVCFRFHAT